jgi:tetratricopeptide (TPR) repeat protein
MRKHEISFVRRQEIVYTPEKFERFCHEFRTLCLQNKQEPLLKRLQIIELIDRLKYQKATSEQAKQAFEDLFERFIAAKDYSAALSCLLESSLGFYPTQVEALKVLFFAEKFAEKHHLEKDIALQSVYHMIGFYLWELNIYALSNQYFKKSLKTGYSIPSDSLRALNGVGINCQKLQDFKTSNEYFEQASRYALHIKNNLFNTVIEGNKAVNFFKMGEWEKAHELAIRYKNVSLQHELWDNAFGALYWLAQIALAQKQPEKSKIWVDSFEIIKNKVQKKDSK